jgi:hypothetical protein
VTEQVFKFTESELRAEIQKYVEPLERSAFEAGKRAERAEAIVRLREELMLKVALASGLIPSEKQTAAAGKTPQELASRAQTLQLEALAEGKELSNIEACRAAYLEAGITIP